MLDDDDSLWKTHFLTGHASSYIILPQNYCALWEASFFFERMSVWANALNNTWAVWLCFLLTLSRRAEPHGFSAKYSLISLIIGLGRQQWIIKLQSTLRPLVFFFFFLLSQQVSINTQTHTHTQPYATMCVHSVCVSLSRCWIRSMW